jgi:hypothetical protein
MMRTNTSNKYDVEKSGWRRSQLNVMKCDCPDSWTRRRPLGMKNNLHRFAAECSDAQVIAQNRGANLGHPAFNSATNSTEVGALNQWGVARYGWGWYQYGITFQPAATGVDAISGMYVLRLSILGLHFPYPF